jgi:hypothetical protein
MNRPSAPDRSPASADQLAVAGVVVSRHGDGLPATGVALAAVVALVVGLLLAGHMSAVDRHRDRPRLGSSLLAGNGMHIAAGPDWATSSRPPRIAGVPLREPITLVNRVVPGTAVIVEWLPVSSPSLLPHAFPPRILSGFDAPQAVRVGGGVRAWRYNVVHRQAGPLAIYVVPAKAGVATIICISELDLNASPCDEFAGSVSFTGVETFAPGPDAAFLLRAPAIIRALDENRARGRLRLATARTARAQAAAAVALARTHATALKGLAGLAAGSAGVARQTVEALRDAQRAYERLALAILDGNRRSYAVARAALTRADDRLGEALRRATAMRG